MLLFFLISALGVSVAFSEIRVNLSHPIFIELRFTSYKLF
jgi:hypothetical protein